MVLHYLMKVDSDTAPDGAQPCVSCMGSQCMRVVAPRAEMMIAIMTAINANAAITRDGERRNVFIKRTEVVLVRCRPLPSAVAGAWRASGAGDVIEGLRARAEKELTLAPNLARATVD